MPTDNPRITITVSEDMLDRIDSYKHEHKLKNQTQAIVSLIQKGFESLTQLNVEQLDKVSASREATRVASDYDTLDSYGKQAIRAILNVEKSRVEHRAKTKKTKSVSLRRYIEPAAAGIPLYAEGEYEYFDVSADRVPTGTDYAVYVRGKSMEPDYPDGSTAFVKHVNQVKDGDIVIAWLEGEGTVIKRVIAPFGQILRLESINREYPDFEGDQLEEMKVYGKVLGHIK